MFQLYDEACSHGPSSPPSKLNPPQIPQTDDDNDVYLYKKSQREGVTKSILYMPPYRLAKKA
jgi:hypothetical protein